MASHSLHTGHSPRPHTARRPEQTPVLTVRPPLHAQPHLLPLHPTALLSVTVAASKCVTHTTYTPTSVPLLTLYLCLDFLPTPKQENSYTLKAQLK